MGGKNNKNIINETRIMFCACESEFQDEKYGPHKRLHNSAKEKKFRCTVCGIIK
jgi:hypothetical protein